MESLEISARTVEEAIQRALEQLGVSWEEVEVSVVREGRPGLLGLGSEEAVVRVTPLVATQKEENNIADTAKGILENMLALMGVPDSVVSQTRPIIVEEGKESEAPITLNISGDDLGILIGRRGYTLSCLQYVVRLIVGHQTRTWAPIVIDVEGYKQRRYRSLQVFARDMADQVKTRGTPFAMEPMSAYERRIVHMALADQPDVITESIGQGEARRVVIQPKEQ